MDFDLNDDNVINRLNDHGLSGIFNLGNTCFLNSAVQILSNIRLFTLYILSEQYKEDINNDKKEIKFLNEWTKLMIAMWEDNCIVKPISFKRVLGEFYDPYSSYRQNDSQEALHKIIDLLHESLSYEVEIMHKKTDESKELSEKDKLNIEAINSWRNMFHKHYSIPVALFYGQFHSALSCNECNYVSNSFEPFNVFELNIDEECNNIIDCLNNFTIVEDIDGENCVFCEKCKKNTPRKRKTTIWKLPNILIFSFSRFRDPFKKIHRRIEYPLNNLSLGNYCEKTEDKTAKYNLVGVSNHFGNTFGGHYTSYCKNGNGSWYHYDDTDVSEIDDTNEVISNQAYVIVYERKNLDIEKIIS